MNPVAPRGLHIGIVLALLAAVALIYGQTAGHDFVLWDDDGYLLRTPQAQDGLTWASFKWAWITTHMSNWHPLTWLSMLGDVSLFGFWAGGHHLVSAGWHAANAVILYFALVRLGGDAPRAALVALLFAVHPLHVESVAWVSERKDLLCAFFFCLALYAYAGYVRAPGIARYLLVFASMAAALLAKPMAVSLPLVLLALDYWPLRRFPARSLHALAMEKLPLAGLSLASAGVTLWVQHVGGSTRSLEEVDLLMRLTNVAVAYATYIVKTFLPTDISFFYSIRSVSPWILAGSVLLLAALGILAWGARRRAPHITVGLFWFAVMLLPVIGIVRVGDQAWATRYAYLPHIGLFVALVWSLPVPQSPPCSQRALWIAFGWVTVIVAAGLRAAIETGYWKDSETLFRRALEIDPRNAIAYSQLAEHYVHSGRPKEAIDAAEMSVRSAPPKSGVIAWASITQSLAYLQTGRLTQAEQSLDRAASILPDLPMIYLHRGTLDLMRGNNAAAIPHLQKAVKIKPDYSEAHNNLGVALARTGRLEEAVAAHRAAYEADPENFTALYNVGATYEKLGQVEEARRSFETLAQRAPRSVRARLRLARLAYARSDMADAQHWTQEVLVLDPKNAEVRQFGGGVDNTVPGVPAPGMGGSGGLGGLNDAPR